MSSEEVNSLNCMRAFSIIFVSKNICFLVRELDYCFLISLKNITTAQFYYIFLYPFFFLFLADNCHVSCHNLRKHLVLLAGDIIYYRLIPTSKPSFLIQAWKRGLLNQPRDADLGFTVGT